MKNIGRNEPCPCGSGKEYQQCCQQREASAASGGIAATDIPAALQAALEHHRAGRLPQAQAIYRQILEAEPDHADALHYLGAIAFHEGKHRDAAELIGQAIRLKPSRTMHYNLGNALKVLGDLDGAAESYRQALALKPDYAEAHVNLGNVLLAQGKLDEAIGHYRSALLSRPDMVDAHVNLGNTLRGQGRLDEAVESYRRALALRPDYAETHNSLGLVIRAQGNLEEAAACYRKAITLKPDYVEAHTNLGIALQKQGWKDMAIASFRKALALKPDYAEAHLRLGNVLSRGRLNEAIEHYRSAIASNPDLAGAHYNLGNAHQFQGNTGEAAESYRQALSLEPDFAAAYSNLLFLYAYRALLDPHEYLAQARGWELACLTAQDRQAAHDRIFQRPPLAGRRLKIGYVSGDYCQHPVSFNIEQVFAQHDRSRVELFAYSNCDQPDAVTERLQSLVEHWVPVVGITDATIRDRIEADGIDVLIDLSGHTAYTRLRIFALRAAPVQVYYLGYFASTGLTEMDYLIGDDVLTPPATDSHFSERVWRLPRIWQVYNGKADLLVPDWRPDRDGTVWLGSFNNLSKLTPATLALWAKLLHTLPEAKLLMKTQELADARNRQRILDAMSGHGIAPDRIELRDISATPGWPEHMACYGRLDIALDPVGGMGGGITTCDALWMGVPVITLEGDRYASRVTATLLNAIGRPEWIAHSEAEYVDKVVALARDVEQREALRAAQRERMAHSPLCDARGLAACMENAYFEMFERWQERKNGRPPL